MKSKLLLLALCAAAISGMTEPLVVWAESQPKFISPKPFDSSAEMPVNFIGHDYRLLISALKKHPRPIKSEFETQSRYEERLDAWKKTPLIGSILPGSRIAISASARAQSDSAGPVRYRYDAETQVFSFWARPECDYEAGVMLSASKTKMGSYVGQNSFGVKRNIARIKQEVICLRTIPGIRVDNEEFQIARYEAAVLSGIGRLLVVGTLIDGEVTEVTGRSFPTIDEPNDVIRVVKNLKMLVEEVWLYDQIQGIVYGKWSQGVMTQH